MVKPDFEKRQKGAYDKVKELGGGEYETFYSFLEPNFSFSCNLFFDDNGNRIANNNEEAALEKWKWYDKQIKFKKTDKVLEIGFGFGNYAKYINTKHKCDVTAINISEEQFKFATQDPQGVNFILSGWKNFPVGQYDIIITEGVLVHQNDKQAFIDYIASSLKPNGILLLREMHLTKPEPIDFNICRGLNSQYYFSGSYQTTAETELQLDKHFVFDKHFWGIDNYAETQRKWIALMQANKISIKSVNTEAWQEWGLNFELFIMCFEKEEFEMVTFICQLP